MIGYLFTAFLITVIISAVIATAGDDIHALWLKIIDTLHHSQAEHYYKQMRDTHASH